jgi:histone chaperone ASF1
MALVSITDVQVLDNPSTFLNPFQFEITFECIGDLREGNFNHHLLLLHIAPLSLRFFFSFFFFFFFFCACFEFVSIATTHSQNLIILFFIDLEWKITYIGSAESDQYDQILDDILVGPVSAGVKKFVFQVS